jgi:hypothetical protein
MGETTNRRSSVGFRVKRSMLGTGCAREVFEYRFDKNWEEMSPGRNCDGFALYLMGILTRGR